MADPGFENIAIVLVYPQLPANIGAACRAMKNMGLSDLRLVHPPLDKGKLAMKLARGATEILEGAGKYFELDEALHDIQYVVGTTARTGGWRHQILSPKPAAPKIMEISKSNKVAILFGAEDCGLPNEAIKLCQMLINVPTSKAHSSLNLAQAVLLIGYELRQAELPGKDSVQKFANTNNIEGMFEDLSNALQTIHFMRPGNPDYWMMAFKRLFARSGLTDTEVNMFRGICRQIRWMDSRIDDSKSDKDSTDNE